MKPQLDEDRKMKIWEEIIEDGRSRVLHPIGNDEKTLQQFINETGMTESQARKYIKRLLDSGKLTRRYVMVGRARYVVFKPV